MDILYVLGNGSRFANIELRLSLRSIEKYGKNIDNVFICGYKPDWIKNVIHIPCSDDMQREKNVFNKILTACRTNISDEFLLMNDDFYMTKEFNAESYPYFVTGECSFINNPSRYQKIQNKTINYLETKSINKILDYRSHCPIRIRKDYFIALQELFNSTVSQECGYSPRLLYGNLFNDGYIFRAPDCKIWKLEDLRETEQGCISTKDDCEDMIKYLQELFPDKSIYEKD